MSDDLRRRLARAAGDGDLDAAWRLVHLLEREGRAGAHPDKLGRIRFDRTGRGFATGQFLDRYAAKCSIQDSSIATEDCLWLGIDDADPKVLVPGKGWQPLALPADAFLTTRMHVHRRLARQLLIVLRRFLDTGSVAPRRLQIPSNLVRALDENPSQDVSAHLPDSSEPTGGAS